MLNDLIPTAHKTNKKLYMRLIEMQKTTPNKANEQLGAKNPTQSKMGMIPRYGPQFGLAWAGTE